MTATCSFPNYVVCDNCLPKLADQCQVRSKGNIIPINLRKRLISNCPLNKSVDHEFSLEWYQIIIHYLPNQNGDKPPQKNCSVKYWFFSNTSFQFRFPFLLLQAATGIIKKKIFFHKHSGIKVEILSAKTNILKFYQIESRCSSKTNCLL